MKKSLRPGDIIFLILLCLTWLLILIIWVADALPGTFPNGPLNEVPGVKGEIQLTGDAVVSFAGKAYGGGGRALEIEDFRLTLPPSLINHVNQ